MMRIVTYIWVGTLIVFLVGCAAAVTPQPQPTVVPTASPAATVDSPAPTASATAATGCASETAAEPVSPVLPTPADQQAPVSPIRPTPAPTATTDSGQVVFAVVPELSRVTYAVGDILLAEGNRQVTVTGSTDQISGQIQLDYDDPGRSTFGAIFVRVLSMRSDDLDRDQSLSDQLPGMNRFPFAMFQVTEVQGFPKAFQIGQPAQFQLLGTLNLKSAARQVVWDTTATLLGNQITGTASTTISLSDYDIPIPRVEALHQALDTVTITVNFTMQEASTLPKKRST